MQDNLKLLEYVEKGDLPSDDMMKCKILGRYLDERLEMITFYGHDDALFLSLQMKQV